MISNQRSRMAILGLAAWLAWLVPSTAAAQATGTIVGVVADETGGVMPGVTVAATNVATSQVRNAVTGPDGYYSVPLLQPGVYDVRAEPSGFKPMVRQGVPGSVGHPTRMGQQHG